MKKFLFIGCGSIGRRHIRNLKTLIPCQILAYRVRNEGLGDFEKECAIQTFRDLNEALDQKPDAVFITNPTSFHLPIALEVAKKNIPFFLEKPISNTAEGVDQLIALVKKNNLLAFVGYKMRFHRSIKLIKKWIDEGALGQIVSARAHYGGYLPNYHPWEDYRRLYCSQASLGGGVVLDASHEIDYLLWFFGSVKAVKSFCGKMSSLEIDVEDTAEIILHFDQDVLGSVHLNYVQQPDFRSCQIVGTKGTAIWQQYRKVVDLYTADQKNWKSFPEGDNYDTNQTMFIDELKHFLACLESTEKPISTLESAKKTLEVALKAKESFVNVENQVRK